MLLFFCEGKSSPNYPFLFILTEKKSPKWGNLPMPNSYWVTYWQFGVEYSKRVYFAFSRRNVCELWLFSGLFAWLPVTLWQISTKGIIPVNPYISISLGLLPAVVYRFLFPYFPREGLLLNVWGYVPVILRPWLEGIIKTPESRSPISWSEDSEDEAILRYALVSHYNALDKKQNKVTVAIRILFSFHITALLTLIGTYFQIIYWSLFSTNNNSENVFSIVCVFWVVILYLYSELQFKRLHEQVYVSLSKAKERLSFILEGTFQVRKDISRLAIRIGMPAVFTGIATLTISFINVAL